MSDSYETWKVIIENSGLFDKDYYLKEYPDVAAAGVDPLWHFIEFGIREHRRPSPIISQATISKFYNLSEKSVLDLSMYDLISSLLSESARVENILNKSIISTSKEFDEVGNLLGLGAVLPNVPFDWADNNVYPVVSEKTIRNINLLDNSELLQYNSANKSDVHNRCPFNELNVGDCIRQYFVSDEYEFNSVTLFFFTFLTKCKAKVQFKLIYVGNDFEEILIAEKILEGDEINDGSASHIWFAQPIKNVFNKLFRIELNVLELNYSKLTIALSGHYIRSFCKPYLNIDQKKSLCFLLNAAPPLITKKTFCFISGCPGDAFRYRCTHLSEALELAGISSDVIIPGEEVFELVLQNYSVVVLHRVAHTSSLEEFINKCKSASIKVIFDTDDLIFVPELVSEVDAYVHMNSEERELFLNGLNRYKKTLSLCKYVTVTTEKLKLEVLKMFPDKKVEIIRNAVSTEMIQHAFNALTLPMDSDTIRIVYMSGSKTHQKDFSVCKDAILNIIRKYKNIRMTIVGHLDLPSEFSEFQDRVDIIPFVMWSKLPEIYRNQHINLAPLEYYNSFTESKSELKYLEAGLLGIPTIASDIGAYNKVIISGENGLLCSNESEWFEAIELLICDKMLRYFIGAKAKSLIIEQNSTNSLSRTIISKYKNLFGEISYQNLSNNNIKIGFITRAPIGHTGGGYKKIFILANYLRKFENIDVFVYVEAIAHLSELSDNEIANYCEKYFDFPAEFIRVGHDNICELDIAIATNWPTAYTVKNLNQCKSKFYFVQDFEPAFYECFLEEYDLANKTYDLGLNLISIGNYLARKLSSRVTNTSYIPFAIDNSFIEQEPKQQYGENSNTTILFFARPNIPRRNFRNGVEALSIVKAIRPDISLKLYGLDEYLDLPFEYENLGLLSQQELCEEFSKSHIHLSFSLTNITTVIYEAMACGCVCVEADISSVRAMVNDGHDCVLTRVDAVSTSEALLKLIDNIDLQLEIRKNGISLGKSLSEKNMCECFKDILFNNLFI